MIDSGATSHMCGDKRLFIKGTMQPVKTTVKFGDGKKLPVTHVGCVALDNNHILKNAWFVPGKWMCV